MSPLRDLSGQHEVAQGYKDVEEDTVYVRFQVKNTENEYFLAWTTTPWTLPSNVALCVNPSLEYVKVRQGDAYYYLAEGMAEEVLGSDYEIIEKYVGKDLERMEYEPLFPFAKAEKKAWYVTCGDYVALGEGTGIVHIAPAFGEDDSKIGHAYDLPFVQMVDAKGNLSGGTFWDGMFVKKADRKSSNGWRNRESSIRLSAIPTLIPTAGDVIRRFCIMPRTHGLLQ